MRIKRKLYKDVQGHLHISKRNIQTGQEQVYDCHNLLCTNFAFKFTSSSNGAFLSYNGTGDGYSNTYLAVGDGTTEPSFNDTALTHQLFEVMANSSSSEVSANCETASALVIFTLPANSSYVGTLAECGLKVDGMLITHSLFKDAEGNPITIEKTDLDEIIITYIVTFSSSSIYKACGFAKNNGISPIAGYKAASGAHGNSPAHLRALLNKIHLSFDSRYVYCKNQYAESIGAIAPGTAEAPYLATTAKRIAQDFTLNGHFIQSILLQGAYADERLTEDAFTLPDFDIMPQAELKDYAIGTGDGETTDFIAPIPSWLTNTEKIYIDGVQQTRNVDYTCDPKHNKQHNIELLPLFNANIISGHIGGTNIGNQYVSTIWLADNGTSIVRAKNTDNQLTGYASDRKTMGTKNQIYLTPTEPFILELADEDALLSNNVDTIYISTYNKDSAHYQYQYDDVTLEASDDLENWEMVLNGVTGRPDGVGAAYPYNKPLSQWAKYDLTTPINKKYWRISIAMNGSSHHDYFGLILMHEGEPIKFTNAPAQNAVITMDCQIDRIWKDNKHVADITLTWEP